MSRAAIDDFLAQRTLAVVGVSRSRKKFGNVIYRALKEKGYRVFPVNPNAEEVEGDRCWPSLSGLPEAVGGVVVVVPPGETEKVARDCAEAGIRRVWMQQGAQSPDAVAFCRKEGLSAVDGACILMFAEPVTSIHRVHRWIWRLLGKMPR